MIALIVGTLLSVAALAYVLAPLFIASGPRTPELGRRARPAERSPREEAVAALREIEFDRETGKLSEADYADLKTSYTRRAVAAMRAEEHVTAGVGAGPSDDAIEARILEYRQRRPACAVCGPRPELDATWCSTCGRWLATHCAHCGASVSEPGARYCSSCGRALAA